MMYSELTDCLEDFFPQALSNHIVGFYKFSTTCFKYFKKDTWEWYEAMTEECYEVGDYMAIQYTLKTKKNSVTPILKYLGYEMGDGVMIKSLIGGTKYEIRHGLYYAWKTDQTEWIEELLRKGHSFSDERKGGEDFHYHWKEPEFARDDLVPFLECLIRKYMKKSSKK